MKHPARSMQGEQAQIVSLLLAIDTATRSASLALHDGARVRVEISWESQDHHTVELTPRIAGMLAQLEVTVDSLAGIAVSLGPGSFTGLRVGVAAAKGLAISRGLKLVGVPTLDIVAQAMQDSPAPVVAVLAAGRGRLCAAKYRRAKTGQVMDGPAWLTTARELGADWEETTRVCGELSAEERHELQRRLGKRVELASPAASLRRAGYLAELGWARLRTGQSDDPATLAPIYIQTPSGGPG
jgi:tRNA threonylcarbamoyladenosine biosynthesis protein TsaB